MLFEPAFSEPTPTSTKQTQITEEALFAMGCFWCGEAAFTTKDNQNLKGISNIIVGYAGGTMPNPSYKNHNGYLEVVKITYNPQIISYKELLEIFWQNIDPFDASGQFCDQGPSYTAAIFYYTEQQLTQAKAMKAQAERILQAKVTTPIIKATTFYKAEEYHQNYKAKNPLRYNFYTWNCGRAARLKEVWRNN